MEPWRRRGGIARCDLAATLPPYHPSRKSLESGKRAVTTEDLDLGEPPKLEQEVACFLRGSMENSKEEDEKVSPEPPVKEFHQRVPWKVETCEMPSWWRELVAVPEVWDHKKLAWEVQASFWLPRRMSELHQMEDCCQALLCHWVFFRRSSCHQPAPSMPAGIFGSCHGRRWYHMLKPSSIGQRKLTCLPEGSHACWQKAWRNWGRS